MARLRRQEDEIESLCAEILVRYEEATFLYRLSEQIGFAPGERAIAGLVAREAGTILSAGSVEVWLTEEGELVRAAAFPERPAGPVTARIDEVVRSGRSFASAATGPEAAAIVALPTGGGDPLGALVLAGRGPGRAFLTGEVKLLSAIAALASAFVRNDRLAGKARVAEARKREDQIAREIHRGLLPRHDPLFAGLEVSGGYRAADGLGGDYYGYVAMSDGSLGIAMADVAGHGVGAALYMAIAKGAIETEARDALSSGDILGRVNEVLASDFCTTDLFATAVFARFLPDARRFVWSNAGHNPPLLIRERGEVETLAPCGPALGIVAGARWRDLEHRFGPGDILVLYTDGLVEARDARNRFFGLPRLIECARGRAKSASAVRENILDAVARHAGGTAAGDDQTLVVARGIPIEDGP